jgi:hypothetical protein
MVLHSVTKILSKYHEFSKVPAETLEAAQARGIDIHEYCANYARGVWTLPLPDYLSGYGESFKIWFNGYVEKVILVEPELRDCDLGFSGHPDLIAVLRGDGFPSVIDYKTPITTGKTWSAQIGAYLHLAKKAGIDARRGGALKLKADGSAASFIPCDDGLQAFAIFLNALNAHRYFNS